MKQLESEDATFWTLCPYCYYLYQYDFIYLSCALKCQNCLKSFHGVAVVPPPPGMLVEGKDQYYLGVACFSLEYGLGTDLDAKKGENVGVARASSLDVKKGDNENLENFVVISDDDSDVDGGDCEIGGKEECKDEKGGDFVNVKKEEDVLQGDEMKTERKRRRNVKAVVRNTKKLMGRGIRYTGFGLGGKADADAVSEAQLKEEVGESQLENTGRRIGREEEEGFPEDDLEFFVGDDDIYVGLTSII